MGILGDVRFAVRNLRRTPGFTAVVILTLALGIGANTAIFSIVNAVVLQPLAYPEPQQLVRITSELRAFGAMDTGVAPAELLDYQSRTDLFSGVAGILPISANVTGGDTPERVDMLLVSWNYFALLGVAPVHGRVFGPGDNTPGVANVAVVSEGFWRRHLNGDPTAMGRTVIIDGDPIAIVGVVPSGFRHPGRTMQADVEVWSPAGFLSGPAQATRSRRTLESGAIARLQPGVMPAQAQNRLDDYAVQVRQQFIADYPPDNGWNPRVIPLQDDLVSNVSTAMFTLLGGVGLVLLIVCVNVANLVLARSTGRRQEMAVRLALGASRARLTTQLLTESSILAVAGGAAGLLVAAWSVQGLIALAPARVPRLNDVAIDTTALLVTAAIAVVTGVFFGIAPALQIRSVQVFGAIKEGGRGQGGQPGAVRARRGLVASEVALATVLLIGAGLLVRSVAGLLAVPLGFDADRLITARMELPRPNDPGNDPGFRQRTYFNPDRRVAFVREALGRLAALPGVEHVAMSSQMPMAGFNPPLFFEIEGQPRQGASPVIHNFQISPEYFDTMAITVTGRTFNAGDRSGSEPVAIVSEAAVRTFWAGGNAIGSRIRLGPDSPWMAVIGVAGDVRHRRLSDVPQPILYRPLDQASTMTLGLLVRTRADATPGLVEAIAREVRAVDAQIPVYAVRSMNDLIGLAVAQRQFLMRLLVAFGAVALGLALLGIYGVMAYTVSQRTREIGVRIAIGANPRRVAGMVLRQGLMLSASGAAIGVVAALVLSSLITSQLFGVRSSDPLTIGGALLLLMVVAAGAAYLPARRAARIDPIDALRE